MHFWHLRKKNRRNYFNGCDGIKLNFNLEKNVVSVEKNINCDKEKPIYPSTPRVHGKN
jgi:hypothetical protein